MSAPRHKAPPAISSQMGEAGGDVRPHLVLIASLTSALVNFRLELMRSFVKRGYRVTAIAPDHDDETMATLSALGIGFRQVPMQRTGLSFVRDLQTLAALYRIFRDIRPDVVLPFTMKPIIYGGLAARLAGVRHRFALVTGLGYVFVDREPSRRMAALRWLSIRLYRFATVGMRRVFVYNGADADLLSAHAIVPRAAIRQIDGSGVDTALFHQQDLPEGPPVFLMVARLLRDKGVFEYAAAAAIIRRRNPRVRCRLLGAFDSNPASISPAEVDEWKAAGAIDYLGSAKDVRPHLGGCTAFVLPSYREGLSRTVLEAMATGRAVITSDAPGCSDPVMNGVTGLVVPVRNVEALAAAMQMVIDNPQLALRMGQAGRRRAEERYDVHAVNRVILTDIDTTLQTRTALNGTFMATGVA